MAYTSEIEKLERRNAENPQGRLFAPLADAYRKQGEVERAMALLQEGLARHPEYIGAQIVLGRCHLDLGQDVEAAIAFGRVLDLDAENVIALKALAEIDERGGRSAGAIALLERLLEIDRGNEEAVAQLQALRTRSAGAPAGHGEGAPVADAGAEVPELPPPAGIELTSGFAAEAMLPAEPAEARPIEGLLRAEPGAFDGPAEPVEGFEAPGPTGFEPVEFEGDDFLLERETDIELEGSAENEFQSRNDAERLAASEDRGSAPNPWQDLAAETLPPVPLPDLDPIELVEPLRPADLVAETEAVADVEAVEGMEAVEAAAEDLTDEGEPELVVTETMAAVYERQGLHHEALLVYRELSARRPEEPRLSAKVAELEAAAAASTPPVPAAEAAASPEAGTPVRPPAGFTAAETGGQGLGSFLRGILAARLASAGHGAPTPAARPELEEAGLDAAPTRPAADPISLSAVFGDDLPPAAPAASQPASAAGHGFSFDAFFGTSGAPQAREGARPVASGEDDLEQFHAWLQGLKK
jgi:tetratricopeptide (TPR) repeat protein